jgi:NAD(P)-dependent dehydrogenase (short-subunit alcohol dehydrogenase family)
MSDSQTRRPSELPPEKLSTRPGKQHEMELQPKIKNSDHIGSGKLQRKKAIITGGDSGIGQAVAVAFAREGADIAICYLEEHADAKQTKQLVEQEGRQCYAMAGDVGQEKFCRKFVDFARKELGGIDILVNNAAEQHPQDRLEDITEEQLDRTFRSNIYSMFFMTKAAAPHLTEGSAVINTSSITAYNGNPTLLDYSSTKGAITAFTRSLSQGWAEKGIRVNSVAPGPIWTPLIPSTFPPEKVESFGQNTPMGRAGQPDEVALAYVFLASGGATYITGQTIHVNGGKYVAS